MFSRLGNLTKNWLTKATKSHLMKNRVWRFAACSFKICFQKISFFPFAHKLFKEKFSALKKSKQNQFKFRTIIFCLPLKNVLRMRKSFDIVKKFRWLRNDEKMLMKIFKFNPEEEQITRFSSSAFDTTHRHRQLREISLPQCEATHQSKNSVANWSQIYIFFNLYGFVVLNAPFHVHLNFRSKHEKKKLPKLISRLTPKC